ncbi:ferredoxin [Wenxinia saemankumensis]|uniref:4Fe-4S ferredoxin-type domain-containing protein n=1 Tax=Wenxinia saemankumensis TaxID=1447782 RepID=A0A1M6C9R6_9RHOB|nr:ferredoxin [Wenxinia saemankumensis]SHI57777.1 hypothetical protein SAMN05444417_1086 [Wenxinia saemankumensis]
MLRREGSEAILLLGPDEPRFWEIFAASAEYRDGAPDPLDRWSARVVGALAAAVGGTALFPLDGPPYAPIFGWAFATGRAWSSPVAMMVHGERGLWVSVRGALALPYPVDLPPPLPRPCTTCAAPCRAACPIDAFGPDGLDTARCHGYLDTEAGRDCLDRGCAVRRACPVGQDLRPPAQSAFHMRAYHP